MKTEGNVVTREELIAQGCTEKSNHMGTAYFENVIGEVVARECTKCNEFIALDGFGKDKRRTDGRRHACKKCSSEDARKWQVANTEKVRETKRNHYEANTEKIRERSRKYYGDNTEKAREMNRKRCEADPEKRREMSRNWAAANPEKKALSKRRRRARKVALPDTLTIKQQSVIITRFNGECALTGSTVYHMDHALPVNCGHGGTTFENMYPLRSDLNISKKDRHIFEWFEANRERFGLSQAKFDVLISYLAEVNGMTTKEYRMYVDWCFDNPRDIDDLEMEAAG